MYAPTYLLCNHLFVFLIVDRLIAMLLQLLTKILARFLKQTKHVSLQKRSSFFELFCKRFLEKHGFELTSQFGAGSEH